MANNDTAKTSPETEQGHFVSDYRALVGNLMAQFPLDTAMSMAVGGDFEATGSMQGDLLAQEGLEDGALLVDVGCGSGRTAYALRAWPRLRYVGIDVVEPLLEYARNLCGRPDWRFDVSLDLTIPVPESSADMVAFFSVFTHLLHEESFHYLREAHRVLRVGGRVVFSFLDFTVPAHWAVFESTLADKGIRGGHLNMFIDRAAIPIWADHLGFAVVAIHDGNESYLKLRNTVVRDNGEIVTGTTSLGQSVCVLERI